MREIKFRAWHPLVNAYCYTGDPHRSLDFVGGKWVAKFDRGMMDYVESEVPPESVEQFTGKKDRDGNEIYTRQQLRGHHDGVVTVKDDPSYPVFFDDDNCIPLEELTDWFGNVARVIHDSQER